MGIISLIKTAFQALAGIAAIGKGLLTAYEGYQETRSALSGYTTA